MRLYLLLFLTFVLYACGGEKGLQPDSNSSGSSMLSVVPVLEGSTDNITVKFPFIAPSDGSFSYQTFNIDAVAKSDYLAVTGFIDTIADQLIEIEVEILADTRVESDEKFGLLIKDQDGKVVKQFESIIINDDFPEFSVITTDTTEGDLGSISLTLLVQLSETSISPFILNLQTKPETGNGFASEGEDYLPIDVDLTFVEGELTKSISIEVLGDTDIEPDEVISFSISHENGETLEYSAIIRSDDLPGDGAPTFIINQGRSLLFTEAGEQTPYTVPLEIDLDGGFSDPFELKYFLREYSKEVDETIELAEADTDFLTSLGIINIIPGTNSYSAMITLIDDNELENIELLEIVLINDAGVEFATGKIYITDNEAPEFKVYRQFTNSSGEFVESTDLSFLESSNILGDHKFFIELTSKAGYDYSFEYNLRLPNSGESNYAIDNDDLIENLNSNLVQSKVLEIKKGTSSLSGSEAEGIAFSIEDDQIVEGNESLFLELRNTNGTPIGEPIQIVILNDDLPQISWANDASIPSAEPSIPNSLYEESSLTINIETFDENNNKIVLFEDMTLDISMTTNTSSCSWLDESTLLTSEIVIPKIGSQQFEKNIGVFSINIESIDDGEVECNETFSIKANLTSNNPGVTNSVEIEQEITVVNTDKAILYVTGFEVEESEVSTIAFKLSMDSDINLDITAKVSSQNVEVEDGDISYLMANILLNDSAGTDLSFIQNSSDENKEIIIALVDDDIVELDESYQLELDVNVLGVPIEIYSCIDQEKNDCALVAGGEFTTAGILSSDDIANLTVNLKSVATTSESILTPLNLLDSEISNPYRVNLSNSIDQDIPSIKLSAADLCLIITDNDCANSLDFSITETSIHQYGTATAAGVYDLSLSLLSNDEVVEPDEKILVAISLIDANSLSDYISNWQNLNLQYNVINDDKLTVTLVSGSSVVIEGAQNVVTSSDNRISWDKDIADNVPSITVLLTETCDENINDLCTITTTNGSNFSGDIVFNATMDIHSHDSLTLKNILGRDLAIGVQGDSLVEPHELATVSIELEESVSVEQYLSSSWEGLEIDFTISNDDSITPTLVLQNVTGSQVGTTYSASGLENSLSDVGLVLSWDKDIASNVSDLEFTINQTCAPEYAAGSSYVPATACDSATDSDFSAASSYQLSNKLSSENAALTFSVAGNTIVEPNEIITLSLDAGTSPSHYFTNLATLPSTSYQVLNDDVIGLSFSGDNSTITEGDVGNQTIPLQMQWTNSIANNVPPINFTVSETCDNGANSHCVADSGDVSITTNLVLHNGASATTAGNLNYSSHVIGDLIVEPNEVANVQTVLTDSSQLDSYLASSWSNKNFTININNDDQLSPALVFNNDDSTTQASQELNSGNQSVGMKLSWGSVVIADNTDDLNLILTDTCTSSNTSDTSCGSSDYTVANTVALIDKVASGTEVLSFSVAGDELVEPDEAIAIVLSKDPSTPSHYFPSTGYTFPTINYEISNDDTLTFSLVAGTNPIIEGAAGVNVNSQSKVVWDKDIASNVPVLAFSLTESCDEGSNLLCVVSSVSGNAVTGDISFSNQFTIHDGSALSVKNTTGLDLGISVTGDALVEPNESSVVTLSLNSSGDLASYLASSWSDEIISFTVSNDDVLTLVIDDKNQVEGSSNSVPLAKTDTSVSYTWSESIAENVGQITLDISMQCDASSPTCSSGDFIDLANFELHPGSSAVTGGSSTFNVELVADEIVEPEEVIELSYSVNASSSIYFANPLNIQSNIIIINDDNVVLTLSANNLALNESSGVAANISWASYTVEGYSSLDFELAASASAEPTESQTSLTDFSLSATDCTLSGETLACNIAISAGVLNSQSGLNVMSYVTDSIVELNEAFTLTASSLLNKIPLDTTNAIVRYEIINDDYLTFEFSHPNDISVTHMSSIFLNEDDVYYDSTGTDNRINLRVCDQGSGIEGGDITLSILADEKEGLIQSDRIHTAQVDDLSLWLGSDGISPNIASSSLTITHSSGCVDYPIIKSFRGSDGGSETTVVMVDQINEPHEWFTITATPDSADVRCADSSQCFGSNVLSLNEGLIVIANDDLGAISFSGNDQCLKTDGSLEVSSPCAPAGQDSEFGLEPLSFVRLTSAGLPILTGDYSCISDGATGYLWYRYALDGDDNNLDSDDDTLTPGGQVSWQWGATANDLDNYLSSNINICGKTGWHIPSVKELSSVLDYDFLNLNTTSFEHDNLSDLKYWTSNECSSSTDGVSDGYWVIDFSSGETKCELSTESLYMRPVNYGF